MRKILSSRPALGISRETRDLVPDLNRGLVGFALIVAALVILVGAVRLALFI